MIKPVLIFCHGFGFNHTFWHNILEYLQHFTCLCVDLEYFNTSNRSSMQYKYNTIRINQLEEYLNNASCADNIIGIGHSYGFIKLLRNSNIRFSGLIGLNAFLNFIGNSESLAVKRQAEYQDFCKLMQRSPINGLKTLYKRSKVDVKQFSSELNHINLNKLYDDLHALQIPYQNKIDTPTLILHTEDDIVVPSTLIKDNFDNVANTSVELFPHGGHGLGYNLPKLVSDKIKKFIEFERCE